MLPAEPVVQDGQIDPPSNLLKPPSLNHIREGCSLRHLIAPAVDHSALHALAMIPDRPFTHPQQSRHRALGMALL